MRSSQVYQPTTTSLPHERNKSWVPSFLSTSSPVSAWSRPLILIVSVLFIIMGLIMIIVGSLSHESLEINNDSTYVTLILVGILLELTAIIAIIFYYRSGGHYIPCCPGKIARIRKHLHENQANGQKASGNVPVSAQYCPPSQPSLSSSPPPPYADVSEEQRLMEEKQELSLEISLNHSTQFCKFDDTDKIFDEDPRIVLSPLKSHEEC